MKFQDYAMNTAYQMGAYQAIANMMRDAIRELDEGEGFTAEFARQRLTMLADQLDETKENFEKAVDMA
jgi:hypothetical protein